MTSAAAELVASAAGLRSVRLELQADCYAGVWVKNASTTAGSSGRPLIVDATDADVSAALDTASRIGDDYIQSELGGGRVNESQFTHGTSAQRQKWYLTGVPVRGLDEL